MQRAVPFIAVEPLDGRTVDRVHRNARAIGVGCAARAAGASIGLLVCLSQGWLWPVPVLTWLTYGGSLTVVHQLIHSPLGFTPRWQRRVLTGAALLVSESGHALRTTHLLHHRTDPGAPDPEGYIEGVPWRWMWAEMWRFRYRLMRWGLRHGADRRRIRAEVAVTITAWIGAILAMPWTSVPLAYLGLITLASGAFAVMAGKGPQTNWGRPVSSPLVVVRGRLLRLVTFSHDRHLEHHLYPGVPLSRLRHLDDVTGRAVEGRDLVRVVLP